MKRVGRGDRASDPDAASDGHGSEGGREGEAGVPGRGDHTGAESGRSHQKGRSGWEREEQAGAAGGSPDSRRGAPLPQGTACRHTVPWGRPGPHRSSLRILPAAPEGRRGGLAGERPQAHVVRAFPKAVPGGGGANI